MRDDKTLLKYALLFIGRESFVILFQALKSSFNILINLYC